VACRTGKPGVGGISLLLAEKGMEGVECRKMKCSGAWSSGTTYITFDDVKVPKGSSLVIHRYVEIYIYNYIYIIIYIYLFNEI
jgi:alkylation response protein AidB-like acyl-CoA dehydrogenase